MTANPRELGYRMPAEWEPHAATWLSWPRPNCRSFPGRHAEVFPAFAELVHKLSRYEPVNINAGDTAGVKRVQRFLRTHRVPLDNVALHRIPTNEPWCRDHGPIFVRRAGELAVVDWQFNGYGKYKPVARDNAVPGRVAKLLDLPVFEPGIVLEGGSIDVNGDGLLLTTEACLLNKNRNPRLSKRKIERYLQDYLGVREVLWLGNGIVGDDTDGHVDDLSRFVNRDTVVTVVEEDPADANYEALQDNLHRLWHMPAIRRIVTLPMPGVVEYRGVRLPASYANFYTANQVVLLPTYRNRQRDRRARQILQDLFPERRVVGIDSMNLIWGLGSLHCLTQQQPAV